MFMVATKTIKPEIREKKQPRIVATVNKLSFEQTDSGDENLEAKIPGGGGRVTGGTEALASSERPVASLTRPPPPYHQGGFIAPPN